MNVRSVFDKKKVICIHWQKSGNAIYFWSSLFNQAKTKKNESFSAPFNFVTKIWNWCHDLNISKNIAESAKFFVVFHSFVITLWCSWYNRNVNRVVPSIEVFIDQCWISFEKKNIINDSFIFDYYCMYLLWGFFDRLSK